MYEPAMTKAFLHGRTEAIRSIQPESVEFTKVVKAIGSIGWTHIDHYRDIFRPSTLKLRHRRR